MNKVKSLTFRCGQTKLCAENAAFAGRDTMSIGQEHDGCAQNALVTHIPSRDIGQSVPIVVGRLIGIKTLGGGCPEWKKISPVMRQGLPVSALFGMSHGKIQVQVRTNHRRSGSEEERNIVKDRPLAQSQAKQKIQRIA